MVVTLAMFLGWGVLAAGPTLPAPLVNAGIDWDSGVESYVDSNVSVWIGSSDQPAEQIASYTSRDLLQLVLQKDSQVKPVYQAVKAKVDQALEAAKNTMQKVV